MKGIDFSRLPVIPRPAVIAGWTLLCLVFCGFIVWFPLTDTDIWWHMASGREMLSHHGFLHQDPFAFSTDHARWIDLHWLFQLPTFGLFSAGGAGLLIGAKCGIVAVTAMLLMYAIPGKRSYAANAIACCLIMFEARYLIDVRPIVLTLLYLSVFLFAIERFVFSGRWLWLLLLAPVQVLWANSQGLFAIGWFTVAAYAVGCGAELLAPRFAPRIASNAFTRGPRTAVTLLIAIPVLVLFSLVNPYGADALLLPFRLLARITPVTRNIFSGNISENAPLFSIAAISPGMVFAVIATAVIAIASFALNSRRMRLTHAAICLMFFVLAVMAERNIVMFLLVAAPVIAYNVALHDSPLWERLVADGYAKPAVFFVFALCAALILARGITHLRVLSIYPKGCALSPFSVPADGVDYLVAHPVPGKMLNSIRNGGYLVWRMYPPQQVYIDSRLVIRDTRFFAEYLAMLGEPERFDTMAVRQGLTHALLPTAPFNRDLPLVKHLYRDWHWRLVNTDGASVLFVRDSLAATPHIDLDSQNRLEEIVKSIDAKYPESPYVRWQAYRYLKRLLSYVEADNGVQFMSAKIANALKK